jgi:hypothetical protein
LFGAVQETTSCCAPAWLAPVTGAGELTEGADIVAGTVVIVIEDDAFDGRLSPTLFVATTVKV